MRTVSAFVAAALGTVLIVPVLVMALPFWVVSICTRVFARLFEPSYLTRDQLIAFDPVFGWKPRPNLDTHHLMVDLFRISTDAQGWRGRSRLEESDVVVFGDSFAAGYGVSDKHLFANLTTQPRIKPIGIGGYSMVQELLWMKELAGSLQGKIVVWFIYFGNDLYDNLSPDLRGYRKPFVREIRGTDEWEIHSGHISAERWPIAPRIGHGDIHMTKLAELCSQTFLAERAYKACEFLIRQGRQICADAGAELVVLTVPDAWQLTADGHRRLRSLHPDLRTFDPEQPDKKIASICESLDLRLVVGASFLDASCYKRNDCHWNAVGHRRVARILADLHAARRAERQERKSEGLIVSGNLNAVAKSAS